MDGHFPPLKDNSGSFANGTKYKYFIDLKRHKYKQHPRITFEFGPLNQSPEIIKKMNIVRGSLNIKAVNATANRFSQTNHWDLDFDWSDWDLSDIDDELVEKQIIKATADIFDWEEKVKNMLK
jgi:hypothetical protein